MPTGSPASLRHRRSFWLGLGILILLIAAWFQSIGHETSFTRMGGDYHIGISHSNGLLSLASGQHIFGGTLPKLDFTDWQFNRPLASASIGLRCPLIYQECYGPWFLVVPYWLIITLFLLT